MLAMHLDLMSCWYNIQYVNKSARIILSYFCLDDILIHYMYMSSNDVKLYKRDFINDVKVCLHTFIWLCNYLRLLMVGAEFHIVKDQLHYWGAICPYNEEFGESDYVNGNREVR